MQRILIAIPLVGLTALGLWLSTAKAHRVTRANFDRIKQGMSREQVDALLGDPSKARRVLGWQHKTSFDALVEDMVEADMVAILKEQERLNRHA